MSSVNKFDLLKRDAVIAGVAGLVVAGVIAAVTYLMGQFTGAEARRLVEATIPTSRLFFATVMTVSATIIALMLTMIGVSNDTDAQLTESHYHRVRKIAFYVTLIFGFATISFVIHCVPINESDKLPSGWYTMLYYGLLASVSATGGGAVAIVSLLYLAIRNMVFVVGLGGADDSHSAGADDPADNFPKEDSDADMADRAN